MENIRERVMVFTIIGLFIGAGVIPSISGNIVTLCDKTSMDKVISNENLPNNPPDKPVRPFGSDTGNIGDELTFSTYTSDSDGDEIYYLFDWKDGASSNWIGPSPSGQEVSASHIWHEPSYYEIRVKAKDSNGAESVWSDPTLIMIKSYDGESKGIQLILGKVDDIQKNDTVTSFYFTGIIIGFQTDPNPFGDGNWVFTHYYLDHFMMQGSSDELRFIGIFNSRFICAFWIFGFGSW